MGEGSSSPSSAWVSQQVFPVQPNWRHLLHWEGFCICLSPLSFTLSTAETTPIGLLPCWLSKLWKPPLPSSMPPKYRRSICQKKIHHVWQENYRWPLQIAQKIKTKKTYVHHGCAAPHSFFARIFQSHSLCTDFALYQSVTAILWTQTLFWQHVALWIAPNISKCGATLLYFWTSLLNNGLASEQFQIKHYNLIILLFPLVMLLFHIILHICSRGTKWCVYQINPGSSGQTDHKTTICCMSVMVLIYRLN